MISTVVRHELVTDHQTLRRATLAVPELYTIRSNLDLELKTLRMFGVFHRTS